MRSLTAPISKSSVGRGLRTLEGPHERTFEVGFVALELAGNTSVGKSAEQEIRLAGQDGSTSPAAPSLCARFGLACPRCTRDSLKCSRAGARQKAARGCERPAALQRRASPAGPLMRCPRSIQTVKEAMRQTCEMGGSVSGRLPLCLPASRHMPHSRLVQRARTSPCALLHLSGMATSC